MSVSPPESRQFSRCAAVKLAWRVALGVGSGVCRRAHVLPPDFVFTQTPDCPDFPRALVPPRKRTRWRRGLSCGAGENGARHAAPETHTERADACWGIPSPFGLDRAFEGADANRSWRAASRRPRAPVAGIARQERDWRLCSNFRRLWGLRERPGSAPRRPLCGAGWRAGRCGGREGIGAHQARRRP